MRRRVNRQGSIERAILWSLRQSYAEANQQAAALVKAYQNNPRALIDLQGEVERGADRANAIAIRAQSKADGGHR